MNARDHIDLTRKRTDLVRLTSIRTLQVFQDHLSDCLFLILIKRFSNQRKEFFIISECLLETVGYFSDILISDLFNICENGLFHFRRRNDLFNSFEKLLGNSAAFICMFFFSAFFDDLVKECDYLFIYIMSKVDRLDHFCLRDLVGTGLDHDNFISCGRYCQLQI